MSTACDIAVQEIGTSLAATLRGIDCLSGSMTQQAFGRLFGSEGQLVPALTILLTIFIALFGFALLTGRTSLGIRSLVPRMMTLGLVLTFATSFAAFQIVFPNLFIGAPDQVASILTGTSGSATTVFADKIDIVFTAISEIAKSQQGGGEGGSASLFSPLNLMWAGAMLFLIGTVGILVTTRIALGVLLALGPVFIVMALFQGTRGMFVGWLKAAVLLAVAPLLAVLSGTLMLEMSVPVINALSPFPGEIDARAAFAFFMVGFVHVSLMLLAMKMASTMVAGWTVFGFGQRQPDSTAQSAATQRAIAVAAMQAGPQQAVTAGQAASARRMEITGIPVPAAANDSGSSSGAAIRETRVYATSHDNPDGRQTAGVSRARGIGSRFRAAPKRTSESIK